jgi:3-hydroxyisobutyrate dehydrogenase-like beta-hydroxyacid dehydrogenase
MSFATMRRFPRFVRKGDFSCRAGMATELMVKDVAVPPGVGKEPGVPRLIAGLVQQLYQLAQAVQGPQAPHQSAVQLYEQGAGVENRARS